MTSFTLLTDSISPKIYPKVVNQYHFLFKIVDELSGIKSFRAELNGKFILMEYHLSRNLIQSKKLNENVPFKGTLILTVTDNVNNIATYTYKL